MGQVAETVEEAEREAGALPVIEEAVDQETPSHPGPRTQSASRP